ncbi:MAG TPA: ECF-type sigma factor [Verrucomicrobiae bacterium]|nr:ECF-type sigma factor [Verrucomicrobiae bacterium]
MTPGNPAEDVTMLLHQMRSGRQDALEKLLPLVYAELRRLAGRYLRDERANHTLQPTALVHEAFLRLAGQDRANWRNRAQFMGVAGQLMRRILVDYARRRSRVKRDASIVSLDGAAAAGGLRNPEEILAVHLTLEQLERIDPQQGRLVELRYFAGLSMEEAAEAMELPLRSAERQWTAAKAWLRAQLAQAPPRPVTNPPRESIAPRQEGPQ